LDKPVKIDNAIQDWVRIILGDVELRRQTEYIILIRFFTTKYNKREYNLLGRDDPRRNIRIYISNDRNYRVYILRVQRGRNDLYVFHSTNVHTNLLLTLRYKVVRYILFG